MSYISAIFLPKKKKYMDSEIQEFLEKLANIPENIQGLIDFTHLVSDYSKNLLDLEDDNILHDIVIYFTDPVGPFNKNQKGFLSLEKLYVGDNSEVPWLSLREIISSENKLKKKVTTIYSEEKGRYLNLFEVYVDEISSTIRRKKNIIVQAVQAFK